MFVRIRLLIVFMYEMCVILFEIGFFGIFFGFNRSCCVVDGWFVYVKNLLMIIIVFELEGEFLKFGFVKFGGVNVKN